MNSRKLFVVAAVDDNNKQLFLVQGEAALAKSNGGTTHKKIS